MSRRCYFTYLTSILFTYHSQYNNPTSTPLATPPVFDFQAIFEPNGSLPTHPFMTSFDESSIEVSSSIDDQIPTEGVEKEGEKGKSSKKKGKLKIKLRAF